MMFNEALTYFGSSSFYKPEIARTLFKKAQFLKAFGDDVEAEQTQNEAEKMYAALNPEVSLEAGRLTIEHLDKIVMIMSR
jgi:hypothetical protein